MISLTTDLVLKLDNTLIALCNDAHSASPVWVGQIPFSSSGGWRNINKNYTTCISPGRR